MTTEFPTVGASPHRTLSIPTGDGGSESMAPGAGWRFRNPFHTGRLSVVAVLVAGFSLLQTGATGGAAAQTDIWVNQATGTNSGATAGTQADPYKSITFALAVTTPTTLHIEAGTYDADPAKPLAEREIFPIELSQGLTLQGESGVANVIISGAFSQGITTPLITSNGVTLLTLRNLTFKDAAPTSVSGGAVALTNASGLIEGCVFDNNTGGSGGALWVSVLGGDFNVIGNTFSGNTANSGCGFYASGAFSGLVSNNTFSGNTGGWGGGFYVSGTFNGDITGNVFSGNTLTGGGGGFYMTSTMTGRVASNTFNSNTVTGSNRDGGGFWVNGGFNGDVTDNTFSGNSVTRGSGGGFSTGALNGNVTDNTFSSNSTRDSGGGFSTGALNGDVVGNAFSDNSASTGGGAYNNGFTGEITRNVFSGNTASTRGGGILLDSSGGDAATAEVSNNIFVGNTISGVDRDLGGAINTDANVTIVNNLFVGVVGHSTLRTSSYSDATIVRNNIFLGGDTAIFEPTALTLTVTDNDFFNVTDILNRNGTAFGTDLFSTELFVDGFDGNHDWDPGLVGDDVVTGFWSADAAFDAGANETTLTDSSKTWTPGEFSGALVELGVLSDARFAIVDNTATELFVQGDLAITGLATTSGSYSIDDFHLLASSQNIDAGTNTGIASDFEGDLRPLGGGFDIGADEFSQEILFALTVVIQGLGMVAVEPNASSFTSGTVVTLTATPDPGEVFDGWLGAVADPASATTTVTMDIDRMVTAVFVTPPPVGPTAEFSADTESGFAPHTVVFSDLSEAGDEAITEWAWDFGDGATDTAQNPSHEYTATGTFTVTLTVTTTVGSDGETKTDFITVNGVAPTAAFSADPVSGTIPLSVQFTDTSDPGTGNITSWAWDFGDGATGTEQNPVHEYALAGTYTVALTVTNFFGSDTATSAGSVTAAGLPPVADFTASPESGVEPLEVQFTDTSTNDPASWAWDFGDGATSTEQNPMHEYALPGTYSVSLTATNDVGTDTATMTDLIVVNGAPPSASFTGLPSRGNVPLTVQFSDTSTVSSSPSTSWAWDFGDGATSTEQNPVHIYEAVGIYTVTLTATNGNGSDSATQTDAITVTGVPPQADFSADVTSGEAPLSVEFSDESVAGSAAITAWSWTFGDGSSSTEQNPANVYDTAGVYTVTLIVTTGDGEDVELKSDFITVFANANEISGTVRDIRSGVLLEGVLVELLGSAGALEDSDTTGVDGTYTVLPLNAALEFAMRFSADGWDTREVRGVRGPLVFNVKLQPTAPATPESLEASAGAGEILLLWAANTEPDLAGYDLYRSEGGGAFERINAEIIAETAYQDLAVVNGIEYTYEIVAVDGDGNESERSAPVTVTMGVIVVLLPDVSGNAGDVVRVPINVRNASGISLSGIQIWVLYDESIVDFDADAPIRVERTALTSDVSFDVGLETAGLVKIISLVQAGTLIGEGHLFDLFFTLNAEATLDECIVTAFDKVIFVDETPEELDSDSSDTGLICVSGLCREGDLDDNGEVDILDVILALKIAVRLLDPDACQQDASDLNGDGRTDSADAVMILRKANGRPLNPPQPGEKQLGPDDVALKTLLEGSQGLTVQLERAEDVAAGDTITLAVTIDDADGLTGFDVTIGFPFGDLTLEAVDAGSLTGEFTRSVNIGDGFVRVSLSNTTPAPAGGGSLLELTFTVADTVAEGSELPLKLNEAELKGQFGGSFRWFTEVAKVDGAISLTGGPEDGDGEGTGAIDGDGEGPSAIDGDGEDPGDGGGEGGGPDEGEGEGGGPDEGEGMACAAPAPGGGFSGFGTDFLLLLLASVIFGRVRRRHVSS